MKKINLSDKEFSLFIPSSDIRLTVKRMAERINVDYAGKEVVLLVVMNGAMIFASDLIRKLKISARISCVKISSYQGMHSSGNISQEIEFDREALRGKHVIVAEDIVDSGVTMEYLVRELKMARPSSIAIATLLSKPLSFTGQSLKLHYVGYEIPNCFVVGYGMDYNGLGRQYEDIYKTT